jgi:hypothetical protein
MKGQMAWPATGREPDPARRGQLAPVLVQPVAVDAVGAQIHHQHVVPDRVDDDLVGVRELAGAGRVGVLVLVDDRPERPVGCDRMDGHSAAVVERGEQERPARMHRQVGRFGAGADGVQPGRPAHRADQPVRGELADCVEGRPVRAGLDPGRVRDVLDPAVDLGLPGDRVDRPEPEALPAGAGVRAQLEPLSLDDVPPRARSTPAAQSRPGRAASIYRAFTK